MVIALAARTVIVGSYLFALVFHIGARPVAAVLAVVMVLVWAVPLLRRAAAGHAERRSGNATVAPRVTG
jgi:hypothetical protein